MESPAARPALVRRAIELNYENHKRASSMRWSLVNGVLLIIFAYDLSCKCPGYMSMLHYVEICLASVACANLLRHAVLLLPRRADQAQPLTKQQQHLLGLSDADLDGSFRVIEPQSSPRSITQTPVPPPADDDVLSLTLSPAHRAWRHADTSHSPHSPHSPHTPQSPHTPHSPHSPHSSPTRSPSHYSPDHFIADRQQLETYLRQCSDRSRASAEPGAARARPPLPPPRYQLAVPYRESGGGEGGECRGSDASPRLCIRLQLDPQRLTQFNLNLRLWIQMTILERLVRQIAELDAAFAKVGLHSIKIGEVSADRLRAVGVSAEAVRALLPFLEPFADQRYVVTRIHELSRGGCLSSYRWNGGGPSWSPGRPTDAALVLSLVCAYLDSQLPQPPPRPFSALHVTGLDGGAPKPGPHALAIHRVSDDPPHYALVLADETMEVSRGRNNLLHTILLFLAAAATRPPPASPLRRHSLGPAGLNLLWVIGR